MTQVNVVENEPNSNGLETTRNDPCLLAAEALHVQRNFSQDNIDSRSNSRKDDRLFNQNRYKIIVGFATDEKTYLVYYL